MGGCTDSAVVDDGAWGPMRTHQDHLDIAQPASRCSPDLAVDPEAVAEVANPAAPVIVLTEVDHTGY